MKPTHRLSELALREIEKKLLPMVVNGTTTDLQASFILGQQSVLKLLRDGYTIGT